MSQAAPLFIVQIVLANEKENITGLFWEKSIYNQGQWY